jgi:hypothetical protein
MLHNSHWTVFKHVPEQLCKKWYLPCHTELWSDTLIRHTMYNMYCVPRLQGAIIPFPENQQNDRDQKLLNGGKN